MFYAAKSQDGGEERELKTLLNYVALGKSGEQPPPPTQAGPTKAPVVKRGVLLKGTL